MKQKLLLLLLALTTLGGVRCYADGLYSPDNAGGTGVSFQFTVDGTNATITWIYLKDATSITIPATITDRSTSTEYNVKEVGTSSGSWGLTDANTSVTSLTVEEGVTTINPYAFKTTTGLTTVQFPSTLTTIGDYAFYGCSALTSITSYSENITSGANSFALAESPYYPSSCVLKVPDGCVSVYAAYTFDNTKTWTYWDSFYNAGNIHELSYPKMSTAGYATYYNEYGYTMPENIEGYVINWTYGGTANLVKVYDPGEKVAPKIPLLWKSTETVAKDYWPTVEAYTYDASPASWPTFEGTNQLAGSQTAAPTTAWGTESSNYYYYKLANNATNGLGWYWGATEGAAFQSAAHKAWLIIEKSAPATTRGFISFGDEDGTTGIDKVIKQPVADNVYYNLQGQRVEKPTKGLYIVNGKKVVIK